MELTRNEAGTSGADWIPRACTLPVAERPLRTAAFDTLFAASVTGVARPAPDRVRLTLRPGTGTAARAAELAAAETGCCSFFTFTLTVTGGGLTLDVAAPGRHTDVIAALADRAERLAGGSEPPR